MITRNHPVRFPTVASMALVVGFALGVSACDSDDDGDDGEPGVSVVDDADVPFDPDVPAGVDTETDERNNLGFDVDEPGPVGNQTDPND